MTRKEYKNLPLYTKLITDAGFSWIKIRATEWKCVGTADHQIWAIGDIYHDVGDEVGEKGDTFILPFDLYLKEIENEE